MSEETLILVRDTFTDNSTSGKLAVDGVFNCFTLEPTVRNLPGRFLAIPDGIYEILMQWSTRFQMDTPHLQNVPGRSFIEIHPGNFENAQKQDSEGCILLGQTRDVDYVGKSRDAYAVLIPIIEAKLTQGKVFISITGAGSA